MLLVLVVAVFGQTIRFGFMELDDRSYVAENPRVLSGLNVDGLRWAFTTLEQANWHPLTWISLMIDASLGRGSPAVFHATNVVLHAVGSILLFLLLLRLTGRPGPSGFVAAVFAIHPLHVESVAWIAERKDVLSTALGFGALNAWVVALRKRSSLRHALALALFAAGLLAKPMLVSWPFLLLLLDQWPLRRPISRNRLVEKIPWVILALASAVITLVAQSYGGAVSSFEEIPLGLRLANACVAQATYLVKTAWPNSLAVYYPLDRSALTPTAVGSSALAFVGFTGLAWVAARRRPWITVGWLWYVASLLPVIGLVQIGAQSMADRYTYVPLVGPLLAVTWEVAERAASWAPRVRRALPIAAGLVVTALATAAWVQTSRWASAEGLYRHTIGVTARNPMAEQALGLALYRQERIDEAIEHFRVTVEAWPGYAEGYVNLAAAYQKKGRFEEAIPLYRKALAVLPTHERVRNGFATLLAAAGTVDLVQGDLVSAESRLLEALTFRPDDVSSLVNLGAVYLRSGRLTEARRQFEEALRIDPSHEGARRNLRASGSGVSPFQEPSLP